MSSNTDKIAVIGIACRFPGAKNLDEFWNNLLEGKDTIKHFTDEELSGFEINYQELKKNPDYVKARGILEDIDKFDADFFGMTPDEAAITDPQHRIWLENAWDAFENAGCDPFGFTGKIGVFAGGFINTYLINNILRDHVKLENYVRVRYPESYQIMIGNDAAFIPTKTAYQFNLKGPAINVQTACSTSLVAISQACQSLFSFESDICLAGGVCVIVPQESGYVYQQGAIPSPDGCCRPFDINGQGTVFSNGVGAVVLKRLDDALNDRDMIYALVSGWALNNDGNNKVSYMAPSVEGQAEVIMMAHSFAGISPEQIGYVEAHGTATQLGDPIEITALKKAFSGKTDKKQFCGIGSVKGNIGHTDAAAGVASFIKTCLAAYHRKIPPSIHFLKPNKYIRFENTPFYVLSELKEWTEEKPLIMGVSSFGIGGTNAHVVIEEPPARKSSLYPDSEMPELLVLSAKSLESLGKRKQDLVDYARTNNEATLQDISFTLAAGRNHMRYRSFIVVSDKSEIPNVNKFTDGCHNDHLSKIAFIFPGLYAQYVGTVKDLYKSSKLVRQILEECFEIVKTETGEDFFSLLLDTGINEKRQTNLYRAEFAQPLLFMIEYALAKTLEQVNIKPDYLIGHSNGEYAAACIAGIFDLQSALKIVFKKGQLMQKATRAIIISVKASVEKLQDFNSDLFEITADNSPVSCYISFSIENYKRVLELLETNRIEFESLTGSFAFHSLIFDPFSDDFSAYVDQLKMKTPEIPLISCLTGKLITPEQAVSGTYWAQQMRSTVQFRKGINKISENEDVLFLEIGTDAHLSSFIKENNTVNNKNAVIPLLGTPDDVKETDRFLSGLGRMYNMGLQPDFKKLIGTENRMKICLPLYPFNRTRHWFDFQSSKTFGKAD